MDGARSVSKVFVVLAWMVIMGGGAATGMGALILLRIFGGGMFNWMIVAGWVWVGVFCTALLWALIVVGSLVADYIQRRTLVLDAEAPR